MKSRKSEKSEKNRFFKIDLNLKKTQKDTWLMLLDDFSMHKLTF